ncbi:MAG TPA: hypothetical protein VEC11_06685 [Allosphingosinicella sp.]|nr:hypothetical protein [Allosphingosinicella sp.]
MSRWLKLLIGLLVTLVIAWLYCGPLGRGAAYVDLLQSRAEFVLVNAEVPNLQARMGRAPLSRTVFLCGPTIPFQRNGTLDWQRSNDLPGIDGRMLLIGGISGAVWDPGPAADGNTPPCPPGGPGMSGGGLPLLVELIGLAALAWLLGLGIGWALRRRPPRKGYLG